MLWLRHGAGANTSSEERRAIQLGFILGYLRTEENHQLQIPSAVALDLPPRAQQLLGFTGDQDAVLGLVDCKDPVRSGWLARQASL